MAKILLIKTSSLGDVIHQLPAVTDIRANFADVQIDWVVEENFAELPTLHPGVANVLPVAIRRWRRKLAHAATWREIGAFLRRLQKTRYDLVLDSQGLIKSTLIALCSRGPRCGYDRHSARESLAALAYHRTIAVSTELHAVERIRQLTGRAMGYAPEGPPDYGICSSAVPWLDQPYVVLLHATSRSDKEWPEASWLALAAHLNAQGLCCVLPWGSERERERGERLAGAMQNALVPPRLSLVQAVAMLGPAIAVVGVDTGLTHLAAALKTPVVALYCASEPGLTGVYGSGPGVNLGGYHAMPQPDVVIAALAEVMRA